MILDVPFRYNAAVVMNGRRKAEDVELVDTVSLLVREVPSSEAPVAAWWNSPVSPLERFQTALRLYDGVLYEPAFHDPDAVRRGKIAPRTTPGAVRPSPYPPGPDDEPEEEDVDARLPWSLAAMGADELVARMSDGSMAVSGTVRDGRPCGPGRSMEDVVPRRVERTSRDAHVRNWNEFAASLLVVDGTVYRRVERPLLALSFTGLAAEVVTTHVGRDTVSPYVYPLTDYDTAVDKWREHAKATGKWQDSWELPGNEPDGIRRTPKPEVLIPEPFEFDNVDYSLGRAVDSVLSQLSSTYDTGWSRFGNHVPKVAKYDRAVLMAFVDLRDARAAGMSGRELTDPMRSLSDAMRRHGTLSYERDTLRRALDLHATQDPAREPAPCV